MGENPPVLSHELVFTVAKGHGLRVSVRCPYAHLGAERPCHTVIENPEPIPMVDGEEDYDDYEMWVPSDGCSMENYLEEVGMDICEAYEGEHPLTASIRVHPTFSGDPDYSEMKLHSWNEWVSKGKR